MWGSFRLHYIQIYRIFIIVHTLLSLPFIPEKWWIKIINPSSSFDLSFVKLIVNFKRFFNKFFIRIRNVINYLNLHSVFQALIINGPLRFIVLLKFWGDCVELGIILRRWSFLLDLMNCSCNGPIFINHIKDFLYFEFESNPGFKDSIRFFLPLIH